MGIGKTSAVTSRALVITPRVFGPSWHCQPGTQTHPDAFSEGTWSPVSFWGDHVLSCVSSHRPGQGELTAFERGLGGIWKKGTSQTFQHGGIGPVRPVGQ